MYIHLKMSLLKKYRSLPVQAKASIWFLICAFLQKGISVLTTPIFTRLLTAAEYGQFNVFNSWLSILQIFISLNLSFGVYAQGLVKFSEDRYVFSSSMQGLSSILSVFWTIIYILFHNQWNELFGLNTLQMLSMLILIWTTQIFNFWAAEQRVLYKYKKLVILTLIVSIAKPVLGILFIEVATDKVTARIISLMLVEVVCFLGLFISQMRRGHTFFNKAYWKYALLFNIPLVPHYLSQTVLNSADRIMISNMISDNAAGIYSLAYSLALIMTLFNTSLMQTISPWMFQKIKEKRVNDISSIAYITLIVIAGANLLLIALAPEAVAFFAPEEYYDAIWVIPPVAMSVFFMYCYDLFAKFAFYYDKTVFVMIGSVIGAILNIVLNYIFIGMFGYRAAGYTTLVCYIIFSIGHYNFMNIVCDKCCDGIHPYNIKIILGISSIFIVCGFALLFTYYNRWLRYSVLVGFVAIGLLFRKKVIKYCKKILIIRKG